MLPVAEYADTQHVIGNTADFPCPTWNRGIKQLEPHFVFVNLPEQS